MRIKNIIAHLLKHDEKVLFLTKLLSPNFDPEKDLEIQENCNYVHRFKALTVEFDKINWFGRTGLNISFLENFGYSKTHGILFCENNIESDEDLVRRILIHELVHLYDVKVRKLDLTTIEGLVESEMRAYDFCEQCKQFEGGVFADFDHAKCVASWVFASVKSMKNGEEIVIPSKIEIQSKFLAERDKIMEDLQATK